MMKIPFLSLKQQYEEIAGRLDNAVAEVLASGWYVSGRQCSSFEEEFSRYLCGSEGFVSGVNSGTDAIRLSLAAAGVGPGDEVIVPANTAIPTASAVCSLGAAPVFCDVDDKTWLIDTERTEELITKKTRAIVPVHLYGVCADMDAVLELASRHGLAVIEDVAQAAGATYKGKKAGTMGDFGAFSFYPTKNLGACGDGGAVFSASGECISMIDMLKNYGQSGKYKADMEGGINSRLDEMQAAILRVKLGHLDRWNGLRSEFARVYREQIDTRHMPLTYQSVPESIEPAYHLFVLRLLDGRRDDLMKYLSKHGIETLIHYPQPLYRQKAFSRYFRVELPVTETLTANILSLPFHQYIKDEETEYMFKVIKEYFDERREEMQRSMM